MFKYFWYFLPYLSILFVTCTPRQVVHIPVKKTIRKPVYQINIKPKNFQEEIAQLEVKIALKNTAESKKDLYIKLFYLLIHWNNPEPDYRKAYAITDSLTQGVNGTSKNHNTYLNWKKILASYTHTVEDKRKLLKNLSEIRKKNKALGNENIYQNKRCDSLTKVITDSLLPIIQNQNEALQKLKEIDMRLEKQRNKIK